MMNQGEGMKSECPACATRFSRADRFCRQCGRDIAYLNGPQRDELLFPLSLMAEDYEHPLDRSGLKRFRKLGPLREGARLFIKKVSEPMIHANLLGSSVLVSATQFPRIHRIAEACRLILDLAPVDIFIGRSASNLNLATALTWGTEEQCCIFMEVDQFEHLSDAELRFLIGREMGHIKSRHLLYLTIARTLSAGFASHKTLAVFLLPMFNQFLVPWQRAAVLTADRAGLVCAQDLVAASACLMKIEIAGEESKRFFPELDMEEFVSQQKVIREKYGWIPPESHSPYLTHRMELMKEFYFSPEYWRVFQSAYDPSVPKFLCRSCRTFTYLTDADQVLGEVTCSTCTKAIEVDTLICPNCNLRVPVEDKTGALGRFPCPKCKAVYSDHVRIQARVENGRDLYAVLGIPRSASLQDVERAYAGKAAPLTGQGEGARPLTEEDIRRKILLFRAYSTLADAHRRSRYDLDLLQIEGEAERDPGATLAFDADRSPRCEECQSLRLGEACTRCGHKDEPEAEGEASAVGEPEVPASESSDEAQVSRR